MPAPTEMIQPRQRWRASLHYRGRSDERPSAGRRRLGDVREGHGALRVPSSGRRRTRRLVRKPCSGVAPAGNTQNTNKKVEFCSRKFGPRSRDVPDESEARGSVPSKSIHTNI